MPGMNMMQQLMRELMEEEDSSDGEGPYDYDETESDDNDDSIMDGIDGERGDMDIRADMDIDDGWSSGVSDAGLNYMDALSFVSAMSSGTPEKLQTDCSSSENVDVGTETDDEFQGAGLRPLTIDRGSECTLEFPVIPPPFSPNSSPRLASRARRLYPDLLGQS
jgi:hypothetical protein